MASCGRCNGTGTINCIQCYGSGRSATGEYECAYCSGSGEQDCIDCHGSGEEDEDDD